MRFVIDAQLPPALAARLAERGHEAEHVNAIGLGDANDRAIWSHASAQGAVLITEDDDFVGLARQDEGTSVIWIRLGNTTNRALWTRLEPLLPEIEAALAKGERLIEIV